MLWFILLVAILNLALGFAAAVVVRERVASEASAGAIPDGDGVPRLAAGFLSEGEVSFEDFAETLGIPEATNRDPEGAAEVRDARPTVAETAVDLSQSGGNSETASPAGGIALDMEAAVAAALDDFGA